MHVLRGRVEGWVKIIGGTALVLFLSSNMINEFCRSKIVFAMSVGVS